MRGAKRKPEGQAVTRHKPAVEWTSVPDVPFSGPKLPTRRSDGRPWPTWTKRWWKAISSMPHAALFSEADWEYAFATAAIAAIFHEAGPREIVSAAAELRQREKVLGTTVDARRDLRIRYVDPAPVEQPDEVIRIDAYREL
jgi:hypothetical protein